MTSPTTLEVQAREVPSHLVEATERPHESVSVEEVPTCRILVKEIDVTFTLVGAGGKPFVIRLRDRVRDSKKLREANAAFARLMQKGINPKCLNLSEMLVEGDQEIDLTEDADVKFLKSLAEECGIAPTVWRSYDKTGRGALHGVPMFTRSNNLLRELKMEPADLVKALEKGVASAPLTPEQTLTVFKDLRAERLLLDEIVKRLGEKAKSLHTDSTSPDYGLALQRQRKLERFCHELQRLDNFAIAFELAHPVLGEGMGVVLSAEEKQRRVQELLSLRKPPLYSPVINTMCTLGANHLFPSWREPHDPHAEREYANDVALNGILSRSDYRDARRALDAREKQDPLECGIVALIRAAVRGGDLSTALSYAPIRDRLERLDAQDQVAVRTIIEEVSREIQEQMGAIELSTMDGFESATAQKRVELFEAKFGALLMSSKVKGPSWIDRALALVTSRFKRRGSHEAADSR